MPTKIDFFVNDIALVPRNLTTTVKTQIRNAACPMPSYKLKKRRDGMMI